MKCSPTIRWLVASLILLAGLASMIPPAHAQMSASRLEDLRKKYDWGSIYLSYGTIPDIIQVLDNQIRLEKIKTKYRSLPPPSMIAFLGRYKAPSARRSIMLFQINFSASVPVAGFLTGSDLSGTINRAPMSPQDVLAAADWIDLYLTHGAEVARVISLLTDDQTTLLDAWLAIKHLNLNPFVSENRISSLLVSFRQIQARKASEVESLKSKDPRLYETLKLFAAQFDTTLTTFIPDFMTSRNRAFGSLQGMTTTPKEKEAWERYRQEQLRQGAVAPDRAWMNTMDGWSDSLSPEVEVRLDHLKLKIYQGFQQLLEHESATRE